MLCALGAPHWRSDWKQIKKETSHSHLNAQSDPSPSAAARNRGKKSHPQQAGGQAKSWAAWLPAVLPGPFEHS